MGIDQIAERCGFASAGTLRHHFRQHFALSPLQYRKQFTLLRLQNRRSYGQ
ncbi:AraC family transcriptional regulator [Klebsiella pneumoniae]|nr:AraC family transcriptional regulator [Klebsiella pneumoniae]